MTTLHRKYIHDRLAEKRKIILREWTPNQLYRGVLRHLNSTPSDNSIESPARSVFQCPVPEEEDEHTVLEGPVASYLAHSISAAKIEFGAGYASRTR